MSDYIKHHIGTLLNRYNFYKKKKKNILFKILQKIQLLATEKKNLCYFYEMEKSQLERCGNEKVFKK